VRCVTDTNVVVSGLLWLGNPGRLLEAAANGRITLYSSPALVVELRSTLSYNRLAKYVQRSGLTPMSCSRATSTSPLSSSRQPCRRSCAIPMTITCSLQRSPLVPISSLPAMTICSHSTPIRSDAQDRGAEIDRSTLGRPTPIHWLLVDLELRGTIYPNTRNRTVAFHSQTVPIAPTNFVERLFVAKQSSL
jgi:hypothetical protein